MFMFVRKGLCRLICTLCVTHVVKTMVCVACHVQPCINSRGDVPNAQALYVLVAAGCTVFSYFWDVERDWELGYFSAPKGESERECISVCVAVCVRCVCEVCAALCVAVCVALCVAVCEVCELCVCGAVCRHVYVGMCTYCTHHCTHHCRQAPPLSNRCTHPSPRAALRARLLLLPHDQQPRASLPVAHPPRARVGRVLGGVLCGELLGGLQVGWSGGVGCLQHCLACASACCVCACCLCMGLRAVHCSSLCFAHCSSLRFAHCSALHFAHCIFWYASHCSALRVDRVLTSTFIRISRSPCRRSQWAFVRVEVELRKIQQQRPELGRLVPAVAPYHVVADGNAGRVWDAEALEAMAA